jgi:hypothetical protein
VHIPERRLAIEKMGIVLLGSDSFIAQAISKSSLRNDYQLFLANRNVLERESTNFWFEVNSCSSLTLINCIGNRNLENKNESLKSNYEVPVKILNKIRSANFHWVQLSSYFSEFKSMYGVDKNAYSYSKDLFSSELLSTSRSKLFSVSDLVLPHIVSPTERKGRLLRELALHLYQGNTFEVSECEQIIPLLRLQSLVDFIDSIIRSNSQRYEEYQRIKVPAEYSGRIRELVDSFIEVFSLPNLVRFDPQKNRRNEFSSLEWPLVSNPSKEILFEIAREYQAFIKTAT